MEAHKIIYREFFHLGREDFVPCELLGGPGVDIHHIWGRQMNEHMEIRGIEDPNDIKNLMALSRQAHDWFGQKDQFNAWLYNFHLLYLIDPVPMIEQSYDRKLMDFVKSELMRSRIQDSGLIFKK